MNIDIIKKALQLNKHSLKDTAKYLNIPYQNLFYHIRKNKIPYNNKRKKIDTSKLQELYNKYQSLDLVAKEIGATKEGVRMAMHKSGLNVNKQIIYSFDKTFFKEDTEKSFYWAGFIAADGCIVLQKNSNILQIGLSKKDKQHLEKFKADISSEHPINDCLVKNSHKNKKWKDSYKSEIKICSEDYYQDLQKFNITYRKTHTYSFPDYVLNHKLCKHFMRGYFDGDGSWYYHKKEGLKDQLIFGLRGTKSFLETYKQILIKECKLSDVKSRKSNGIGVLEYGGNIQCKRIYNYLYCNSNIYLDRKRAVLI